MKPWFKCMATEAYDLLDVWVNQRDFRKIPIHIDERKLILFSLNTLFVSSNVLENKLWLFLYYILITLAVHFPSKQSTK